MAGSLCVAVFPDYDGQSSNNSTDVSKQKKKGCEKYKSRHFFSPRCLTDKSSGIDQTEYLLLQRIRRYMTKTCFLLFELQVHKQLYKKVEKAKNKKETH